jgi:hypothetical protein
VDFPRGNGVVFALFCAITHTLIATLQLSPVLASSLVMILSVLYTTFAKMEVNLQVTAVIWAVLGGGTSTHVRGSVDSVVKSGQRFYSVYYTMVLIMFSACAGTVCSLLETAGSLHPLQRLCSAAVLSDALYLALVWLEAFRLELRGLVSSNVECLFVLATPTSKKGARWGG